MATQADQRAVRIVEGHWNAQAKRPGMRTLEEAMEG